MKPRLIRRFGIWTCGLPALPPYSLIRWPQGYGDTPLEAYQDWWALMYPMEVMGT